MEYHIFIVMSVEFDEQQCEQYANQLCSADNLELS